MSILKFSDGVQIDTSGPIRSLHLADGWYVVGNGFLIPVKDEVDTELVIKKLMG
jgi:hypothetical protein